VAGDLASVVSGLRSVYEMSVAQFPRLVNI